MKIAVIGCGYVGLVTAYCLAEQGHHVICVDNNLEKLASLNAGICPIYEPGLTLDKLHFSSTLPKADIVFIAVGTPQNPDGSCDISHVLAAAHSITGEPIVVIKSTVPVGTAKQVENICDCDVVSNPEFLREGEAIKNCQNPDRVIIGTKGLHARTIMDWLYKGQRILHTSNESAELIKYASNAFLAMKLTFINEMAWFAEEVDADVREVALGMGMDPRIGEDFLKVGPGYGGSCFPKDLAALNYMSERSLGLVRETMTRNWTHQLKIAERINSLCGSGKTLGVLGVTFKANTDDTRKSPALAILPLLDATLKVYDPKATVEQSVSLEEALACDAVVIMTEWNEFKNLKFSCPVIDLRNLYEDMPNYYPLGRAAHK